MAEQRSSLESMVAKLQSTYKGKKIFLTGHTGFKGSWLLAWLHHLGAEVKGYALAPENEFDLYNAIGGSQLCTSVIADIRNKEKVKEEILSFQPDFVFHLAAQPLVRLSYQLPTETFDINAQGTAHLLDALRVLSKPCIAVLITTDKVYHNLEIDYAYKETDRLGGYDPYSASKACAELIIDSYRNSFFNPVRYDEHKKSISVARAGNVIGGGDWSKDRIIPDIVRSLTEGKPVNIRNPSSVRPWQHVMEPLLGYLTLGVHQYEQPLDFADAFNFGPMHDDTLTVEELVKKAIQTWGRGEYFVQHDAQMHEAGLLKLDIGKAKEKLGWVPVYTAQQAVQKTINWYKVYTTGQRQALPLVIDSIKGYIAE